MNDKPLNDSDQIAARDDAFWTSLFKQETEHASAEVSHAEWTAPKPATPRSELHADWQAAQELFTNDGILKLRVTGFNKGGLLVVWRNLQGFVPASQLVDLPQFHIKYERQNALRQQVDEMLTLKIIEIDEASNRFILSQRAAQVAADDKDNLLKSLRAGTIASGRITNLTEFGAFVDLGGLEGLIHISELSWGKVMHPSDVVKPGQHIRVLVLSVSPTAGRVALSLKQVDSDPWLGVTQRYKPGQIVSGTVSNILHFGAFVVLEKGLEGLVHISELAEGTFLHPRNVVQKGQTVHARILRVDEKARRLALSLRDVTMPDES